MKLSILQENLAKAVSIAGRSASARATLPILNHLLLSTDQGRLKVSATNLEVGVNVWVGAKVEGEGSLAVPARVIQELVLGLPTGKLELEVVKGSLNLKSGGIEANIAGIEGSEFPTVPTFPKSGGASFPQEELTHAVEEVAYAAAAEDGRPVLTGIFWKVKDGNMELVATDGYRLAKKEITIPTEVKGDWQALVPARALVEVAKIASDLAAKGETAEDIKVALSSEENQISFSLGDVTLTSRLLEGQYPTYESIIPKDATSRGIFGKDELVQALRLTSVFARDLGSIVRLSLSKGTLELSANTAQVGDEKSQVKGDIEGEEMAVAFNSRYLLDAISRFQKNQISFESKGALSPGVFRGVGDETLLVLVMPVRLQG
jgi:DNA polymerase-3 subunit beta